MDETGKSYRFGVRIFLLVAALTAAQEGTRLVLRSLGAAGQTYSDLVINTVFLFTCIGCVRLLRLSREDVGLKILWQHQRFHVGLCLAILSTYCLYYLLVVKISTLRPVTSATIWGLSNFLVVAFAEEIFFRGLCYHIVEESISAGAAVFISGLFFGLAHFRQGAGMLPRFITGWLWGSVRYATGMIHLLVFPVHFAYNAVWLLFHGNWESQTTWALLFPLAEFLGAILIVSCARIARRQTQSVKLVG